MKKFMRGETHYVRYADDFLLTFQYEEDAITVMRWLKVRLAKFGLEVAEDKTRILPFGKYLNFPKNLHSNTGTGDYFPKKVISS